MTAAEPPAPAPAAPDEFDFSAQRVALHRWSSATAWESGTFDGARMSDDGVVFGDGSGVTTYTDPFGDGAPRHFEHAGWTSPVVVPGFDVRELVASWNARTPPGTWIEVTVSGRGDDGRHSSEYVLARWADDTSTIHRTSVGGQADELATVAADTLSLRAGRTMSAWRLRLTLFREPGSQASPTVSSLGGVATDAPVRVPLVQASPAGVAAGTVLEVPAYSQVLHAGQYPELDNGGESWCSPTSVSMVLAYWQREADPSFGPLPDQWAWVERDYADPWVCHAAASTFDYAYDGAGNWPFNTAYAATFGLDAFVTRLRSLSEAELFIAAGIPLVLSTSFEKHELAGARYRTLGHLMVLVGFDAAGDPVMNDPASHQVPSNDEVRVTYDRAQLESAWRRSGGVAYVIRPRDVPLPPVATPHEPAW